MTNLDGVFRREWGPHPSNQGIATQAAKDRFEQAIGRLARALHGAP
jgi:hypothetical protein